MPTIAESLAEIQAGLNSAPKKTGDEEIMMSERIEISAVEAEAIDEFVMPPPLEDPDPFALPEPIDNEGIAYRDTREGREVRRNFDTFATGLTLGAYDELAGMIGGEEAMNEIRENVRLNQTMNPTRAFFTDLGGNLITGGGMANMLLKGGMKLPAALGSEGAFTGFMYGESGEDRAMNAVLLGATGASIGKVIGWAVSPSKSADKATMQGGRTSSDDLIDDGLDDITIKQAVEDDGRVLYRTNNGKVKDVSIVSQLDNGLVQIKSGNAVFVVPRARIESVQVGKTPKGALAEAEDIGQYANLDDEAVDFVSQGVKTEKSDSSLIDIYKKEGNVYALDSTTQAKILELDDVPPTFAAKRFSYLDEAPLEKGRKADEIEYNWRDAETAGEFFDGIKTMIKGAYNNYLVGASDFLMKIAPEVGAKFQRFTETALRFNTISFESFMQPMEKVVKGIDKDRTLKAMLMDYTNMDNLLAQNAVGANNTITTEADLFRYVGEKYGADQAGALARYFGWNKQMKARHADYLSGEAVYRDQDVVHIHTALTREAKQNKFKKSASSYTDEFEVTADSALEQRTRSSIVDDLEKADEYLNPLMTDFRRNANLENLMQMTKVYSLPKAEPGAALANRFDVLARSMIERGMSPKDAKVIATTIKNDFVGQTRSPNNWIQFLNSWGYAGSLAGPKSALLNLHDIPMAAVIYGPSSFKGVFKNMGYSVEDKGIRQNVGEFMNYMQEQLNVGPQSLSKQMADTARKGTDLLMRGSGFAWMDAVGKNGITRMIIQDAVDNVDNLAERWGFYFSKRELDLIEDQIRKHGTNVGKMTGEGGQLFEELFFAGLGQQQLISSAGRPAAWSRHPNMRFMWALRGFAIKQLALAQRNIFDNIAKGNKKAAWDYMKRYVLFSAGTFGLLNESRQWIWGDGNFTAGGVLMGMGDQIVSTASINTIGLNDYQWGKMMEDGVVITWLRSLVPVGLDIPADTVGDVVDAIDDVDKGWQTPLVEFPIIEQWSNATQNVEDKFGIIPNPMAQFNKVYIQQELPE
jgi:hypothetical protein